MILLALLNDLYESVTGIVSTMSKAEGNKRWQLLRLWQEGDVVAVIVLKTFNSKGSLGLMGRH